MKIITTTLVLLASIVTMAQQGKSGKISYQETVKLTIKLEGADAQFANMLPKEQKSTKVLLFNENAALYKNEKADAPQDIKQTNEDGGVVQIKMGRPEEQIYFDLKNNKRIEQKEFMGRKFLIEAENTKGDWKITANQKEILGYPCQEATKTDTAGQVTTVWFCPSIPVSVGPAGIGNLPGAVLALSTRNGEITIEATSINFEAVDNSALLKPKEGKKISMEEYKNIVAEKMKEMRQEFGGSGSGNVIIRMETDTRN